MAFTTIQGSGANDATSLVGTSGVDFASITTAASYFVGAQQADDTVGINTNLSATTVKGGQGTDTITFTAGASLTNSYVNGNSNNDTIGAAGAGANLFTSTLHGGQGNDTLTLGNVSGSLVNGNKNADTLNATTVTNSTIYGGQGNDGITLAAGTHSNSLFSGDNDTDTFTLTVASTLTNITLSGGQGNDTINGNFAMTAATGTVVNGDAGIDTITFGANFTQAVTINGGDDGDIITAGAGADTVNGEAGNDNITNAAGGTDTITGGLNNDSITLSGSNERIVQNTGDSTAATVAWTNLAGGGAFGGGGNSAITFGNGIDLITNGLGAGDRVQTSIAGATILDSTTAVTNLTAGNYFIRGAWNAGTNAFTQADAGADGLFIQIAGGSLAVAANNGTSSIAMVGSGALVAGQLATTFVV